MTHDTWQRRLLPFVLIGYFALSLGYGYFFFTEFKSAKKEFDAVETDFRVHPGIDTLTIRDEGCAVKSFIFLPEI